jgi:hypothetical protein
VKRDIALKVSTLNSVGSVPVRFKSHSIRASQSEPRRHLKFELLILVAMIFVALCSAPTSFAQASDVYITPDGSGQGVCTNEPHNPAWFNSAGNWGTGSAQIGPGTTVHLCGTFVGAPGGNMFTTKGNGSSVSPVTIQFESGATLSAPYWSNDQNGSAAILCNGNSFIVIDGGANGIITATASGQSFANKVGGDGVYLTGCNNSEVRNLTITNMFVNVKNSSSQNSQHAAGIAAHASSNISIHNNTISNAATGVQTVYDTGTTSNISIYANTISHTCGGIIMASDGTSPVLTNFLVFGNDVADGNNWDSPNDLCHEDAFHGWAEAGGNGGVVTGLQIYNNYLHGDWGCFQNGYIYLEADGGSIAGNYYNNVIVNGSDNSTCGGTIPNAYPASGYIGLKGPNCGSSTSIYNNTISGNSASNTSTAGIGIYLEESCGSATIKNNIVEYVDYWIATSDSGSAPAASDYNDFYQGHDQIYRAGSGISLAAWQASGFDGHSVTGNPVLSTSSNPPYRLTSGTSAAWAVGTNLTPVGMRSLDSDKAGIPRPPTSAPNWDMGAYYDSGGAQSAGPAPPTNVAALVQ